MTTANYAGGPGMSVRRETEEVEIAYGRNPLMLDANPLIISTSVDAASSPTTMLRAGLLMAFDASNGKWAPYVPYSGTLTGVARGILLQNLNMLDLQTGTAQDKTPATGIAVGGTVRASLLKNLNASSRAQLRTSGFVFDDEMTPATPANLKLPQTLEMMMTAYKSGSYTVLAADSGTRFVLTAAGTMTLPTIALGLRYEFIQSADANMVIAGTNLIHKGSASGATVTFSTNGEKIGSSVMVEAIPVSTSTLKWLVRNTGGTTATVA